MMPQRKRRKPPRALRFANVKVGDVLIWRRKHAVYHHGKHSLAVANDDDRLEVIHQAGFVIVTDRWFDPCQGQYDPLRGEMAGVQMVGPDGAIGTKLPYTLRGLASQRHEWATPEQAEKVRQFVAERAALIIQIEGGETTLDEARLRATPYRELVRDL